MTYGKILIEGKLKVITGLHIGTSNVYSAIGAVDTPVIIDPLNNLPIIPGSSLKGKLRTLLARKYNNGAREHQSDDIRIKRLFGGNDENGNPRAARALFSDSIMNIEEQSRLRELGAEEVTEVKFENTIARTTGVANPRQIERVIRGSQFDISIVYDVYDESEALEDIKMLMEGFELLKYDYLGGHGTRGYGRVELIEIGLECVTDEVFDLVEKAKEMWSV